jgi:SAM-dependent methyltransferase
MDYAEWHRIQTEVHGQIVKPVEYHLAEQAALKYFFGDLHRDLRILDVGCGIGLGLAYLERMGFVNVHGVEVNERKAFVGQCFGLSVVTGDIGELSTVEKQAFDVIYCSHAFEHVHDPDRALAGIRRTAAKDARAFFILPYPDTGDPTAHCASEALGLRVKDDGESVARWFTDRGLRLIDKRFSSQREPEVWLQFRKGSSE